MQQGESGILDEPHSYDFLIYAELQSGQDVKAKQDLAASGVVLDKMAAMPGGGMAYMTGMIPYYRAKLAGFYALEMHDWKTAAAMEPVAESPAAMTDAGVLGAGAGGWAVEGWSEGARRTWRSMTSDCRGAQGQGRVRGGGNGSED